MTIRFRSTCVWFLVLAGFPVSAQAADPPYYVKQPTWQDTLFAARTALASQPSARANQFRPYTSPVLHGGEAAVKIEVPVAGVQDLYLLVTGVPHVVGGAATWADALLVAADGKTVIASRGSGREVLKGRCAFDVNLKSGVSGPLKIAGQVFEHGLHVYADSQVRIPLGGKFERFEAWIGIDDWVGRRGAVRFDVTDAAGAARADLWDLLERDFTTAEPRRQMRWEREDRLWDTDVVPGDFAELARRYA
ncbi:MAG: NPCBM/NEW2 domain-containing protein, partial [Planctomycetota bacterium]|nr:NPCBM/NEW2 domain-containing protein [Planctomycetota bacterium]